ncbi:glycerate kinase [Pedococcus sp. 5OH_020]|uniref:glycerate kinase n=1 Tax=Pedococcus sp. 5OH_020 TaxID=2989814 RepID=UPI0022E9EB97|nr:glycerate kinase [Pedococcus sp. 5OH_020]
MRVLIAPDSFKGSVGAAEAAAAIARGWLAVRPRDEVVQVPLADGGEGTLELLQARHPKAVGHALVVTGPDGRPVQACWLQLPDGTAFVELARASGLPLMRRPDALGAHTVGFGQLLAAAAAHPATRRIVAAVGGSASTDGGSGALRALGARWLAGSSEVGLGGAGLAQCDAVDVRGLVPAPSGGVTVLVDVDAPLLGPRGAAAQFGPQKGATPAQVAELEVALTRFASVCRTAGVGSAADVLEPGTGAAGGTAYGLMALWQACLMPGSALLGTMVGLADELDRADVVVTGEGRLDEQSTGGKVVGHVLELAGRTGTPVLACVGSASGRLPASLADCRTLTALAGSTAAAMGDAAHWLEVAAGQLAEGR